MSTYVISDIHGAYDEFQRLLDRIRFRWDGSDSLYLLGDFADWGAKSMETLRLVRQLDERYDFVHCLMGNHEMMFLSAIEGGIVDDEANDAAVNWLVSNRGLITWNAYVALAPWEQEELHQWLRALPLSFDLTVNGHLIMLAHAYPYYYDMEYSPEEAGRRRMDAVWRRLMLHENPFDSYTGQKRYDLLICGHTITDFYERERDLEQKRTVMDSVAGTARDIVPVGKNRIFHGDWFVDIDCGAKCMSMAEEDSGLLQSARRALLERAQLAACCLETGEEFYVSHPQTPIGEMMDGTLVPGLEMPGETVLRRTGVYREEQVRLFPGLSRAYGEVPELAPPEIDIPLLRGQRGPGTVESGERELPDVEEPRLRRVPGLLKTFVYGRTGG